MRAADPSRYPQQVCRGLARLLSHGQVNSEEAQWLAKQIGSRLPPGWGAVWTERGCRIKRRKLSKDASKDAGVEIRNQKRKDAKLIKDRISSWMPGRSVV